MNIVRDQSVFRTLRIALAAFSLLLLSLGCENKGALYRLEASIGGPIPPTVDVVHYRQDRSGFSDITNWYALTAGESRIGEQLVSAWNLGVVPTWSTRPKKAPIWWPTEEILETGFTRYRHVDEQNEEFWEVLISDDRERLFVSFGNW